VNDQLTRDVAARRQIEAVLREREARIRRLIDADIIGIFLWDIEGPVLEANDAFLHMVGYDREDLIAGRLCWTDLTPPEWRERDVQQLEPELERTGRLQPFEKEYFRKDGSRVPVLIGLASFDKTTTQGVAFVLDLTERKRAEQALHRSEAYLAEAQRMTHTGSWAWDPHNDQVLYWSEEMFRIMGLDPQDCVPTGPRFSQLIHPEDRDRLDAQVQKSLRQKVDYVVEHRIVRPDQTVRDIQTIGHPVLNGGGEVVEYVGIVMDVTERKRAEQERERLRRIEEELARINRVSMMGELTASLAHEIKQPMAAAVSNAEACLQWLAREQPDLEETREAAREMVKEARRAAEIITRLRSLFRKEEISREVLEINQVIIETVSLVREEADRRSIPVRTELDSPLPRISADRVQLQQVLINLMLNGMEAMDSTRGELTIRSQLDHEGRALISVTDMGTGLPAGQRDKIFDAFFTTKPQGTGMGLAISRSIIESHGGRLWANANTGRGTTFHFTLPAAPADGSLVTNEPSFTT
jgi:PAS domain S-box-containing protein